MEAERAWIRLGDIVSTTNKAKLISVVGIAVAIGLGAGIAVAGSQNGAQVAGVPVFAIAVALAFGLQWLAFVPSYIFQTERFYDLMGSLTFIAVTGLLVGVTPGVDARGLLAAAMVVIWAVRLGGFLFVRVSRSGADDRFDEIKVSWPRFLLVWTMQGLWISSAAAAAWIAITSTSRVPLDVFALVGLLVWVLGFGIATQLCFLIPLGAVVTMPAAVAGATMLSRELIDRRPAP